MTKIPSMTKKSLLVHVYLYYKLPMSRPNNLALTQSIPTSTLFLQDTCFDQYIPLHNRNPTGPDPRIFLSFTLT